DSKNNTAYLTKKGMRLDFGGIAKGWVADKVRDVLRKDGVTAAIIDLGGNVVVMGHSPLGAKRDWHVGIQDPTAARGTAVGTIPESDESIVTAGTYEQYLISHGHKYIYLFD
ncbi:MAG TPA: FAD:protein FMN transferase, partial [Lactobacillus sp.]|nr:FAD:protein FMN transferase [Lactobacillus sp.]